MSNLNLYKKSIDGKYFLFVGVMDDKCDIIFNEPIKCIHQVDYESPSLFELHFYSEDGEVIDRFPDKRELLVGSIKNRYSIGYYDEDKIVFWEQYIRGI